MKYKIKYALLVGLCLSLFFSTATTSVYANSKSTQILIDNNIVDKNDQTAQDKQITRGDFIVLLNKTFRVFTSTGNQFTDIVKDSKYYYDVMAARRNGYLSGTGNNVVNIDNNITRAEIATMISRLIDKSSDTPKQTPNDFKSIPAWATDSIDKILSLGLMKLDGNGNFNPQNHVTNEDAFYILSQVIEKGYNNPREDRILNFTAFDNYQLTGRLCIPKNDQNIDKLVIYVNGSGPNTYMNERMNGDYRFIYHDMLAEQFIKDGTAYFSYNTRGISIENSDTSYKINEEKYKTYLPVSSAKDVKTFVDGLRKIPELANAKIYLLGWSEGTITAPHAVVDEGVKVDGLLLAGYCNGNMKDAMDYQMDGTRDFYQMSIYFDCEGKDIITKEDYAKDPYNLTKTLYEGAKFEDFDVNKDGVITKVDYGIAYKPFMEDVYKAIKVNDNEWISKNYPLPLTTEWFNAHFEYGKNIDTMVKVNIPVYIFQGTYDMHIPYQDSLSAEATFKLLGKTNLTVNLFDKEDHNLSFDNWLINNQASQGFSKIFEVVENELK